MPTQPSWIERVPEMIEQLDCPEAPPFLDRQAVETLFGVRRRQAIALMGRFGGYQVGKTFLVPCEAVVRFLRDPRRRSAADDERERFSRVRLALGETQHRLRQRRIAIPIADRSLRMDFSRLPEGLRFEPGRLTIAFERPPELLEKLFALAQALANDYETFERFWTDAGQPGGAA